MRSRARQTARVGPHFRLRFRVLVANRHREPSYGAEVSVCEINRSLSSELLLTSLLPLVDLGHRIA